MTTHLIAFLPALALMILCACGSTDARKAARVGVATTGEKVTQAAAVNVAAVAHALNKAPATNRAVQVAKEFNDRAAVLLPQPRLADLLEYRRIVDGLLAEKAAERVKAERELATKDGAIADLQTDHAAALHRLREAEGRLMDLGERYEAERSKTWWSRLYSALGFGGVIALCIAFPVLIPILTNLLGALVSAMPSLAGLFGVVSKRAMDAVVGGVETFKAKRRAEGDANAVALLKDELHKATDASHRRLIAARKVAIK